MRASLSRITAVISLNSFAACFLLSTTLGPSRLCGVAKSTSTLNLAGTPIVKTNK